MLKIYKNLVFPPLATIFHVSTYKLQYELLDLRVAMEVWSF
jgi:hypothetical protein